MRVYKFFMEIVLGDAYGGLSLEKEFSVIRLIAHIIIRFLFIL